MCIFRHRLLTLALATGAVLAASFDEGQDAYLRQDDPAALRVWQPLAKAGDTRAQFNLGVASAQIVLGLMCAEGRGVARDDRQAIQGPHRPAPTAATRDIRFGRSSPPSTTRRCAPW